MMGRRKEWIMLSTEKSMELVKGLKQEQVKIEFILIINLLLIFIYSRPDNFQNNTIRLVFDCKYKTR